MNLLDLLTELQSLTPEQLLQPVQVATPQGIINCTGCSVIEAGTLGPEDQIVLETFIY